MRAVNLLPRDAPKKSFEAKRGVVVGSAGGVALVSVVLASMILSAGGAAGEKQAELDALRAQIAAIPAAPATDTSNDDALAAQKSARVGALSAALSGRIAWDRVLRQVSLVLPDDVWLTNLAAAAPTAGGVAGESASKFTLTGSTYSQSGVARFLSRLSVIPDFANVQLQSSASVAANARDLVQFTIVADVRDPGAAATGGGS